MIQVLKSLSIVLLIGLVSFGIAFFIKTKKSNAPCVIKITLETDEIINAKRWRSDSYGMTIYTNCDNKSAAVPTVRIKSIK